MSRLSLNKILLLAITLLIAACSGTRHLPPGEKLYGGAKIKLVSSENIRNNKKQFINATVNAALRPRPNKRFLGMRLKLCFFMAAGESPKNKFTRWLKKQGEAPVLIKDISPNATAKIIDAALFNIGIFNSSTSYNTIKKKHTVQIIYSSIIHKPYTIDSISYNLRDSSIRDLIVAENKLSIIQTGSDYNLNQLKDERSRLDAILKNNGYFYFNPDYLLFNADTAGVGYSVHLTLSIKDSIPVNALIVYRIRNVFIDQAYSLNVTIKDSSIRTNTFQNIIFLGSEDEMLIRPKVIAQSVYLKQFEIYTRNNHNTTLNRIMSMGTYKFVQIKFSESDTLSRGFLDVTILMTPMPKHTFRAGIDLVSKSNNNLGPRINLSYLNRNAFKGAELLTVNLAGSFEAQIGGGSKNAFSYSINPQLELYFPRFIVPFKIKTRGMFIPKTRISLSFNYLKKVNYFDMRTFQFIYGFKWKQDRFSEHELNPVNVSITTIANKSADFTALLESNPFLKKSYEEQFISGGSYTFTFNEQILQDKRMQFYFQLSTEVAGNSFSLIKLIAGKKPSAEMPLKVVGAVYSQYAKLCVDGRGYYNLKNKDKLALRVFAGVAAPYWNATTLPYTKQFFSGGPNSIRAFHINSLGPGTYHQLNDNAGFLQLGGDIKIELNAEYRFTIYKFFKGAVFADAGNIWQLKSNPAMLGNPLSWSGLYKELAVGAGIGVRLDVSFFILRFDFATPLRKPWLENNHRWVFDQMMLGNSSWRKENLVLNVAIGYPF